MKTLLPILCFTGLISFGQVQPSYSYITEKTEKNPIQLFLAPIEEYKGTRDIYHPYNSLVLPKYTEDRYPFERPFVSGPLTELVKYNIAIKNNPKDIAAYYERGIVKFNLNDYPGAIADFKKVTELDPTSAAAYYNLGSAEMILGNYEDAVAAFDKTILIDPGNAAGYYRRGIAKIASSQKSSGCSDLRKAADLRYQPAKDDLKNYCDKPAGRN